MLALGAEYQGKLDQLEALLARMPTRRRINLLLELGVPADDVMGVEKCSDHRGARIMSDVESLTFDGQSIWCKGCFRWVKVSVSTSTSGA